MNVIKATVLIAAIVAPVTAQRRLQTAPVPAPVKPFKLGTLTAAVNNIRLSEGLSAKIIARSGQRVAYTSPSRTTTQSSLNFHANADGADVFALPNGGYIYASNAELDSGTGGVFGVEFDSNGLVKNYKALLTGTSRNCNGGRTPWNTWVSCEEVSGGKCWQVDPQGLRSPQVTTISGTSGGSYEAFAYDARNTSAPAYFITEDVTSGELRRFRPPVNTPLAWESLTGTGTTDYLQFLSGGRFQWTTSLSSGQSSASTNYPNAEGIAVHNGKLSFVSKTKKRLFILNLDARTYTSVSTSTSTLPGGGRFDGQPDHVVVTSSKSGVLILTEDGGTTPGAFAYDGSKYLSYFESNYSGDEITGIAFSPDRKFMFAVVQSAGLMFQISRDDGLPFEGRRVLKWKKELGF